MRAVLVVITDVFRKQAFQMAFIHGDNMVQQVSSATFDPTLRHTVLPGTLEGGPHGAHLQGSNGHGDLQPVFRIPVEDEKSGRRLEGKCFPQLLDDPTARRVLRDIEVQNSPAAMADHKKAVEYTKGDRWGREEIHRRNGFPVIAKEGEPTFGRLGIPWRSLHPA